MYTTRKERDKKVYETFTTLREQGQTITQATYACMELFNYTTPCTIYNIRKRMEGGHDDK